MLLGILALTITGLSWSVVGIVMGGAGRKNVDPSYIQCFSALFTSCICLALITMIGVSVPPELRGISFCYLAGGVLNFALLQLMAKAMKTGPNGIIWGIVQSGVIFPFLMGSIFFAVPLTVTRIAGLILLLIALLLFGLGKQQKANHKPTEYHNWLLPAFAAFLLCGMQQCVTNYPSYHPGIENLNPLLRTQLSSLGILFSAIMLNTVALITGKKKWDSKQLCNRWMWIYICSLQAFGLLCSYFLLYRGMDALAAAGIGSLAYPVLVSSCIAGFFLYSVLVLHEKNSWMQYTAFVLCVTGIVFAAAS